MSKRKLLQINPVLRGNTSTGRIMQEIGDLAMSNGWESYIAYSRGRDGIKPCNSRIIPVGNRMSTMLHGLATRLFDRHGLASNRATKRFIREIEKLRPDVIHIHNIHGYFLNYRLLFDWLSKSGIPVVWTVHDCWLYTGHCYYYSFAGCNAWQTGCGHCPQKRKFPASLVMDRSRRNFEDKKAAFTSMPHGMLTIVPVSEWIGGEMQKSYFKDYGFRVIHNGINTEIFNVCKDDKIKEKYNISGRHVILGVASIWNGEKGLDDFIRLSEMLREDEVIVLVGIDDKTKKRLPSNIVAIRRTENIHALAELYSAADVFVNPTWQDNYPTVNLEAIACGTPVVTYRTGGSIEAVTQNTGIIVPQGDLHKTLEAVREIMSNGKEHYRTACREYALAHFRKEDRYADYLRLYDEICRNVRENTAGTAHKD